MGILKLALYGGAAYLGYKVLAKPTVDEIVNEAALRLDPNRSWVIVNYNKTDGSWTLAGFSSGKTEADVSQLFADSSAALAWIKLQPVTGTTANVTFSLGA